MTNLPRNVRKTQKDFHCTDSDAGGRRKRERERESQREKVKDGDEARTGIQTSSINLRWT